MRCRMWHRRVVPLPLNYGKPFGEGYIFTARVESTYTGPRYSIYFSDPYEFTGTYRQMPGYALLNAPRGDQSSRSVERYRFRE